MVTDEKILDIMVQQFRVWLDREDSWKVPDGLDSDVFNATKATDAMEHVYRNTKFAIQGLEWADRKAS